MRMRSKKSNPFRPNTAVMLLNNLTQRRLPATNDFQAFLEGQAASEEQYLVNQRRRLVNVYKDLIDHGFDNRMVELHIERAIELEITEFHQPYPVEVLLFGLTAMRLYSDFVHLCILNKFYPAEQVEALMSFALNEDIKYAMTQDTKLGFNYKASGKFVDIQRELLLTLNDHPLEWPRVEIQL